MRRKSLAMLFVIALILPTILLTVPQVSAQVVTGVTHTLSPDSGPVMTHVTSTGLVYGTGSMGGRLVRLYWEELVVGILLAETTTKSDGSFEAEFNVPADVYGEHAVYALDVASGKYSQDTFFIEADIQLCPNCGTYCTDVTLTGTGWKWWDDHPQIQWATGGLSTTPSGGMVDVSPAGSWSVQFHVEVNNPGVYTFHVWQVVEGPDIHVYEDFIYGPWLELDHNHGQYCDWIDFRGDLPGLTIGTTVYIYFIIPEYLQIVDCWQCLPERILVGETETIIPCGYFEGKLHVPLVPEGEYEVIATDEAETVVASAWFNVHPCIYRIDPLSGVVGTTITVNGTGYGQFTDVTVWMSGLLPTGVPLEAIVSFHKLVNLVWAWDETNTWAILTVGYFLPVAYATTNCKGSFEVSFDIPECWGGYHPIVATDDEDHANIIGDWEDYYNCPVFPDGLLIPDRCALVVNKPGILRVLPKIWTEPACGVSGQTITLYGQGLSAFEAYLRYTDIDHDKCPDIIQFCEGEIFAYLRFSGFVLDFGPNKRWIDGPYFPNMGEMLPEGLWHELHLGHYILNGQYDEAWGRASETTWNSYSPLMLNPRGTLVSDGMSFTIALGVDYFEGLPLDFSDHFVCALAFGWEYRQVGCPFLTVPWLQPQECELVAYRFDYIEIDFHAQWPGEDVVDLSLEFFTYDDDETATTWFTIECLQVDTDVPECPECPEVDLSEIEERLAALEGDLDALTAQLSALDAKITGLITDAEGNIIAKIDTSVGAINLKLDALDARITGLVEDAEGNIVASIETALGPVKASLDDLNAYVTVDLATKLATIETKLGTLEGKLVSMEGKMATIETDVGTITTKTDLIVNHTGSMPVTIALSLIAAIAAIAAAVLILRKVYIA